MNINATTFLRPLKAIITRFHLTLLIVVLVSGVGVAVLLLTGVVNDSTTGEGYVSPISAGTIDRATLERVNELHTSSEPFTQLETDPAVRSNPFAE